ncbi:aminoacyl-histidine dipeptidase [Sediminicola luteus]|uniref:Cytosol non-specific dipeptidase n=1 Tax=Sediminicola luteus TaxID=319238 RepID=A0A2A4GAR6_9FLAO|nr:aminoacyl-histidine dipeptidase [Sediminicola luteus]PCE64855.1 cytosol nonspecific dipeptidase [Sediminicola luteus]
MHTDIRALEPQALWNHFCDLNAIPRASKKEERVIAFMVAFGEHLGLETFTDSVDNVIIRKPASPGMEDRAMVTLQSHLDMVHQKSADTVFDFDTEGIRMRIDGDWVQAEGTTLGADNGIGVAAIMALLSSTDIAHPPLEALFTIDEETGMTGALGLQGGILKGQVLLNLDTEEDDEIDIGCAGGVDVTATGSYDLVSPKAGSQGFLLSVKGLNGGHSGMDIDKGLGNANKIMNRLLRALSSDMQLQKIDGGGLRNAIPRESKAWFLALPENQAQLNEAVSTLGGQIKKELSVTEPNLEIRLESVVLEGEVMGASDQERLIQVVSGLHNGVFAMSAQVAGLVETSNNLARVLVSDGAIQLACLTRSSVESAKADLASGLRAVCELGGYTVSLSGAYPGWEPNPNSEVVKVLAGRYEALFHEKPRVVACHAGLECGILGTHYPDMDMVSFGPTITGAHSPDEQVNIPSVQKFWRLLLDVLQHSPKA